LIAPVKPSASFSDIGQGASTYDREAGEGDRYNIERDEEGSRYRGVVGAPAAFDAAVVPRLLMLRGDVGASTVLREGAVRSVDWSAGAPISMRRMI